MFFIIHKTIAKLDIMHHTSILTQFVTQTRENKLSFRSKKNYRKIKIPTPPFSIADNLKLDSKSWF